MVYDLIVIGAGPAGYLGAERAAKAGMSTLVIEKNKVGGVCLNEGCVPTKSFLYSAKMFDHAKEGKKYGLTVENVSIDHSAVAARKDKVVRVLVSGIPYLQGAFQWIIAVLGFLGITYVMFSGARRLEIRQDRNYGNDPVYQKYVSTVPIMIPLIPLYSVKNWKAFVA